MEELAARVEALERQTIRLKTLFFIALVGAICLAAAAGTFAAQNYTYYKNSSGTVRLSADGLYIYDPRGTARMALYLASEGRPVIRFRDAQGKDRMFFGETLSQHMPRIQFNDAQENQRLYVGMTNQSTGQVSMFSKDGTKMSSLDDDQLRIADDNAVQRIYFGVSDQNDPFLRMYGSDKTERLYAGIYSDGKAGFESFSSAGESTWSSP